MTDQKQETPSIEWQKLPIVFRSYIQSNPFSLTCLIITVVLASTRMFHLSNLDPWKNWETCALGFTFIYTSYIYYTALHKKMFDHIPGPWSFLLGFACLALIFLTLMAGNDLFHVFNFNLTRIQALILLIVITLIFSLLDYVFFFHLAKPMPKLSEAYFLSLRFSDIPVAFAFVILTLYAVMLHGEGNLQTMDSFFGGTVAFQMMLSNIIWTLTDDAFLTGK